MSGEVRVLRDHGGVLASIVDSLHTVTHQLHGVPHALVGGVAVLVHVQGHRVTHDIDQAVQAAASEVRRRLSVVAEPSGDVDALVVMPNGVPVDVLVAGTRPPRVGIGLAREARAHAVRWAVESAQLLTIASDPVSARGPVTLAVARPSASVAMKLVEAADPMRGAKLGTDLLDIWRLLAHDPIATVTIVAELRDAPDRLHRWVAQQLADLFDEDPSRLVAQMAPAPTAARSVEEVRDLWDAVIGPTLA